MFASWKSVAGLIALLIFVISWALDGEFLQKVQDPSSDSFYDKPYMLRWATTAGYSLFGVFWLPIKMFRKRKELPLSSLLNPYVMVTREEGWILLVALVLSVPFFFGGWLWYLSIPHTSVVANTVIFDSYFIFIFGFSMILLKERISLMKVLSCAVCVVGLLVVAYAGSQSKEEGVDQTIMGYIFLILATVLFALYEVLFKKMALLPASLRNTEKVEFREVVNIEEEEAEEAEEPENPTDIPMQDLALDDDDDHLTIEMDDDYDEETKVNTPRGAGDHPDIPIEHSFLLLGAIGVFVFLLYWPGLILIDWAGIEVFQMPSWTIFGYIWVNVVIDGILNITLLLGISWTSPLFMGVGSLLNIPFSMLFDILFHSYLLPFLGYLGMALIIAGFFILLLADYLIANPKPGTNIVHRNIVHRSIYGSWGLK